MSCLGNVKYWWNIFGKKSNWFCHVPQYSSKQFRITSALMQPTLKPIYNYFCRSKVYNCHDLPYFVGKFTFLFLSFFFSFWHFFISLKWKKNWGYIYILLKDKIVGRIWWHCAVTKMKTVCVTGASGYIASWIVKFLLQRGYTVKASVRDLSQFFFFFFFFFLVEWWWWLLHSGLWVFDVIFAYWNIP